MSTTTQPLHAQTAAAPSARRWPRPRTGKRALRLGAAALLTLAVAYLGISFRYADTLSLVKRHEVKLPATTVAADFEDVAFTTADGLTLRGWWFPAQSPRQRAVVLVHGKDQDRIDSSFGSGRIARFLLGRGYSALLFDLRGHGESDGLRWGLGRQEALDVAAAIDLAAAKAGVPRSRVAVIGESMGAGSAIMALERTGDVGPMVVDSAYADVAQLIDEIGPQESGLPGAFSPGMMLMAKMFFGIDLWAVKPIDVVRAHPAQAFFFIACDGDRTVAPHHAADLRAASADPASELWVATGCGHVKAFITHPAEWESRVLAFLERGLGR